MSFVNIFKRNIADIDKIFNLGDGQIGSRGFDHSINRLFFFIN